MQTVKLTKLILKTALIFCSLTSHAYAHPGKAYYFKTRITTADTTVTGYFNLPYEFLPDSILNKFRSDNEYFKTKIKSDCYQNGIELYSFLLNYGFNTAEKDTSYVLCLSKDKIHIKSVDISHAEYKDVIVYDSWGNELYSDISKTDLEWLNKSPAKVIMDKSEACLHQYFILYETSPEISKIIDELMPLKNSDPSSRETLRLKLNDFKIIYIIRHRCI